MATGPTWTRQDDLPPPSPAYPRPPATLAGDAPPWSPAYAGPAHAGHAPPGITVSPSLVRAFLRERARRFDPRGVHWGVLLLTGVLLAAWILLADVLLTPGLVDEIGSVTPSQGDGRHLVTWIAFFVAYALTAWSLLVVAMTHGPMLRALGVLVPVGSSIGMSVLMGEAGAVWASTWGWWLALMLPGVVSTALAIAAAVVPRARLGLATGAGAVIAGQWVVAGLMAFLGDSTGTVFIASWTVFAFLLLIVLTIVTLGGVAEWAQRAHASTDGFARRLRIGRWVPPAAAAAVLVLAVLRLTVLSDLFGPVDATVWTVADWTGWGHAIVAGGVIVLLVVRSEHKPLRSRGTIVAIALLSFAAGAPALLFAVTYVLSLALPASMDAAVDTVTEAIASQTSWTTLACMAVMLVLLLPPFRQTTGRTAALVALALVVPLHASIVATVPGYVVLPPQVLPVVAVAALGIGVASLVLRRDVVDRVVLLRLAIVPIIAVHAGQLLPAVLADVLARPVLIVASVVALLLFGPARTEGRDGASRAFVAPFAVQVGLLGVTIVGFTLGGEIDALTSLAVIYLALPIATVLCCRIVDGRQSAVASMLARSSARRAP